jgi:methylated-DNA-[protein]-cysteine S-methyltransferase
MPRRLFCFMLAAMPTSPIFSAIVPAPFGAIGVRTADGLLRQLVYLPPSHAALEPADKLAEQTALQLQRYFAEPDFRFELPLAEAGTPFQQRVWGAIASIPRGAVRTYGDVARLLRSAPRAVGQACGANWYPLAVPCHRVTATGGLGGFSNSADAAGFYLGVKRWLLAHEGVKGY